MQVLVASRNAKKLRELQRVLYTRHVAGIELLSLKDVAEYPGLQRPAGRSVIMPC